MAKTIVSFFSIILAALLAGTMFGIWMGYDPIDLSSSSYIEQQQNMIRHLNVLMPLLGLATLIVTVMAAFLQKESKVIFISLLIASLFLIISGLITRFGNQPINDIVITWSKESPPSNWIQLRDKWWSLHIIRTGMALSALCIIIGASIRKYKKLLPLTTP